MAITIYRQSVGDADFRPGKGLSNQPQCDRSRCMESGTRRVKNVQGYLAHKKIPPP